MLTIFWVCFLVGIILSIAAFVLREFLGFIGIDGIHFDEIDFFLPFTPSLIIIFLTAFGGTGIILMKHSSLLLIFIISIAAVLAYGITYFIYHFILKPLKKAQNTSAPEETELIGVCATVSEKIFQKGFGEITYVVYGNTFLAPAKSTTGEDIPRGVEVTICWIENHIFYVAKID